MTSPRPSPIGEGVKKGKTQIIPVGSIIIFKAISVSFDFFEQTVGQFPIPRFNTKTNPDAWCYQPSFHRFVFSIPRFIIFILDGIGATI